MDHLRAIREIYRRDDIRNAMLAVLATNESVTCELPAGAVRAYNAGFSAAIVALAIAFNIELPQCPVIEQDHNR